MRLRTPRTGLRPGFHLERGMRVGLFGGSFNPPHAGHLHVAETALTRLGLHRLIWLVAPQNPLKDDDETAPLDRRVAAVRRIAQDPRMVVSGIEARLGVRYTIDTLRWFKARFPGVRFVWVMGSDNLNNFHRWRGWAEVIHAVPIAVVDRPGAQARSRLAVTARRFAHKRLPERAGGRLIRAAPPAWIDIRAPLNPLSSSAIRRGELKGRPHG